MWSVEYSSNTKCFHIDDLNRVLKLNYRNFMQDTTNDWQIIGIFENEEQANNFCEKYIEELRKRQNGK